MRQKEREAKEQQKELTQRKTRDEKEQQQEEVKKSKKLEAGSETARKKEVQSQTDEDAEFKEVFWESMKEQAAQQHAGGMQEEQEKQRKEQSGKGKSEKAEAEAKTRQEAHTDEEKTQWVQAVKAAKGKGKSLAEARETADKKIDAKREERRKFEEGLAWSRRPEVIANAEEKLREAIRSKDLTALTESMVHPSISMSLSEEANELMRELVIKQMKKDMNVDETSSDEEPAELCEASRPEQKSSGLLGRLTPWRK